MLQILTDSTVLYSMMDVCKNKHTNLLGLQYTEYSTVQYCTVQHNTVLGPLGLGDLTTGQVPYSTMADNTECICMQMHASSQSDLPIFRWPAH